MISRRPLVAPAANHHAGKGCAREEFFAAHTHKGATVALAALVVLSSTAGGTQASGLETLDIPDLQQIVKQPEVGESVQATRAAMQLRVLTTRCCDQQDHWT